MMRQVVVFDLDDTLVAEVLFLRSGIRHIAKTLSEEYPILKESRIVNIMEAAVFARQNHYSALENMLEETGMRDDVDIKKVVAEFRNHVPDPEIYHPAPHIAEVLENLKKCGIPIALITDGRSVTQRNKIMVAGIDRLIDNSNILISEETGYDKTYPDNFLALMKKYAGYDKFHYVGDNPQKDFYHPSRLGWETHLVHPFPLMIHQGIPR